MAQGRDGQDRTATTDHPEQCEGRHVRISFEAAEAIGRVMQAILMSQRVPHRLKVELLGVALATLRSLESHSHLANFSKVMRAHLIQPYGFRKRNGYTAVLRQCFDEQDHILRAALRQFSEDLDAAGRAGL